MNSIVIVVVSTSESAKSYKQEIRPLNNKFKIDIKQELKRLYFAIDNGQANITGKGVATTKIA